MPNRNLNRLEVRGTEEDLKMFTLVFYKIKLLLSDQLMPNIPNPKFYISCKVNVVVDDRYLIYYFTTSCFPPKDIVRNLIYQYPQLSFTFEYESPENLKYGRLAGENGEVIDESEFKMTEDSHPWWFTEYKDGDECRCVHCR